MSQPNKREARLSQARLLMGSVALLSAQWGSVQEVNAQGISSQGVSSQGVIDAWLKGWLDASGEFNQSSLVWLGDWPWWGVMIALSLGVGALALAWWSASKLNLKRKLSLISLRALTLTALSLLLLEPAARLEDVTRVKNHVAVLVDASSSMSLPVGLNAQGPSRWEAALEELRAQRGALDELSREHVVTLYRFDEHLERVEGLEALAARPPTGEATRLTSPLDELLTRTPASELAAVWLLSDGIDTQLTQPNPKRAHNSSPQGAEGSLDVQAAAPFSGAYQSLAATSQRVKAPIHTLTIGPREPLQDVSIVEVRADDFAFARNVVSVDVELLARGYTAPISRHVTLWRGRERLSQRLFTYDPRRGAHSERVTFEFVPEETGEELYQVEVEVGDEEQVTLNNTAQLSMRVIRDKIRTLQVVGRPSWDVRALRHHLQSNPNVELISFFILRTNASIETASPDELSLIPFPTQELFEERLGSFDLMVFQDFTYRGYRMERYLPLIRDYVRSGGSFVMVGGEQSMSAGGYANTPIAELLPFELPPNAPNAFTLGEFSPKLSALGQRHPITALSLIPEENEALWARLPQLGGHNHAGALKPNAQVLAWRELKGGGRAPLITAMPYGEGRVLTLNTDSLWRWTFEPKSEAATHYHKLWSNAIRWLIRDPSLNPLRVSASRERLSLGQALTLKVQALNERYEALKGAEVTVALERLSVGSEASAQGALRARDRSPQAELITTLRGVSDEAGQLNLTWRPTEAGAYRARAQAAVLGAELSAQDLFIVARDPLELREVSPRSDLLGALSAAGEGRALERGEAWAKLPRVQPNVSRVNRRVDVPLWSGAWLFALLVSLLSSEWLLRRRWGLA